MSDFIDVHGIAIRNRIAVDGRVTPTVEDWNALLEHIDKQDSEIKALRKQLAEKEILRLKELEGLETDKAELVEVLSAIMPAVTQYINYEHDGDPWSEDARQMGEMDLDELERDGYIYRFLAVLQKHKESK